MKKVTLKLAMLLASFTLVSASFADTQRFVGTDGNWFNARNWSAGHLPGPNDDVVIGRGQRVVVDPTRGYQQVTIRDLTVSGFGSLETLPGTIWTSRDEYIQGSLIHRGTDASSDLGGTCVYVLNPDDPEQGWSLNPTAKSKRVVDLQSSITMGLGGTTAAGPSRVGQGYYANITAQRVHVSGRLNVVFKYGFVPQAGDAFRIVSADSITGQYAGLREGAMVTRIGNIGLFIHYTTSEHILLARQIG